ncbi:MAG: histidine kinase [Burkholderiales bacterium]|nr:histidine kinase [Burkholderiales bacterium]
MTTQLFARLQIYCQTHFEQSVAQLLKKKATDYLRVVFINTLCAILVTYVMRTEGDFFASWVFAMCIGTIAFILIDSIKYLAWGRKPAPRNLYILLCIVCTPIAYFLGLLLAAAIFSYPIKNVLNFQWTYASSFVAMTAIVSIIAAWYFWHRTRMSELLASAEQEKARTAAIERQAMQAQLQLLQAQIEPHMLFNTLANLQGLIALDQQRAQHMLAQLIVYLRTTLSASRAGQTTLQQEFTLMQAYLELLSIRMGKRLRYTLDLPAALQEQTIAPMLLQPLVENAIKHGIEPHMDGGDIHVSASTDAKYLHLSVRDNGLGLPFDYNDHASAPSSSGQHVGNANIRDRLLALYGPAARLSLTPNQPQGAIAQLYLPLNS